MGALPTRRCNNCGICAKASFCERRHRNRQLARALKRRSAPESGSAEDLAALQNFAQDMRSGAVH